MINLTKRNNMFNQKMADLCLLKEPEKVIVFYRHGLLFAFNFNTTESYTNILVPVPAKADYDLKLSTDDVEYGGQGLVEHMKYQVKEFDGQNFIELYLPARTGMILKEGRVKASKKTK